MTQIESDFRSQSATESIAESSAIRVRVHFLANVMSEVRMDSMHGM